MDFFYPFDMPMEYKKDAIEMEKVLARQQPIEYYPSLFPCNNKNSNFPTPAMYFINSSEQHSSENSCKNRKKSNDCISTFSDFFFKSVNRVRLVAAR